MEFKQPNKEELEKIMQLPMPSQFEKILSQGQGIFYSHVGTALGEATRPHNMIIKLLLKQLSDMEVENRKLKNETKNRAERRREAKEKVRKKKEVTT